MAAPPFLDTNILLYAGSNAPQDQPKKQIAAALIVSLDFCLSSQVIQEYLSNALGKKTTPDHGNADPDYAGVLRSCDRFSLSPML